MHPSRARVASTTETPSLNTSPRYSSLRGQTTRSCCRHRFSMKRWEGCFTFHWIRSHRPSVYAHHSSPSFHGTLMRVIRRHRTFSIGATAFQVESYQHTLLDSFQQPPMRSTPSMTSTAAATTIYLQLTQANWLKAEGQSYFPQRQSQVSAEYWALKGLELRTLATCPQITKARQLQVHSTNSKLLLNFHIRGRSWSTGWTHSELRIRL